MIRLIVGLGNSDKEYVETRHNIGERVAREFAKRSSAVSWERWQGHDFAKLQIPNSKSQSTVLIPQTFMNVSGQAISKFVRFYKIDLEDTLIIHDELDLAFGKIQLKFGGSAGGHRGVQSMIEASGTEDFWRLRIGIGRPPVGMEASDFVLAPFGADEETKLPKLVDRAVDLLVESLKEPQAITQTEV